jgi:hypothetical protein
MYLIYVMLPKRFDDNQQLIYNVDCVFNASMTEKVDVADLKSAAFGRPGSTPGTRTIIYAPLAKLVDTFFCVFS